MKHIVQLTIIFGLTLIGLLISNLIGQAIPGSIISMLLLALLLISGTIKSKHILDSGNFLLRHMTLFFIPSCVAIIDQFHLLEGHVAALIVICVVSTLLTFTTTALTVKLILALQRGRKTE